MLRHRSGAERQGLFSKTLGVRPELLRGRNPLRFSKAHSRPFEVTPSLPLGSLPLPQHVLEFPGCIRQVGRRCWPRYNLPVRRRRSILVESVREESGTVRKDPGVGLRIALIYPNTYRAGMSNLGLQQVYHLLNQHPSIFCERVFWEQGPPASTSALRSLETGSRLTDFPVLAFSLAYENDYANLIRVLQSAGIEPLRDRRAGRPLIIAGGAAVSLNPEVLADILDLVVVGEAEATLPALAGLLIANYGHGNCPSDFQGFLAEAARLEGIYCPGLYHFHFADDGGICEVRAEPGAPQPVVRATARDLQRDFASSRLASPQAEFGVMFLTEVARGCPRRCTFCATSYHGGPARNVPLAALQERVEETELPTDQVGLVAASLSDYPWLGELCERLLARGSRASLGSLRPDRFDGSLAKLMVRAGQRTLTIAPEAATEKIRHLVGKEISNEEVLEAAAAAHQAGLRRLKLYFLYGLPGEEEEDLRACVSLVREVARIAKGMQVVPSFSIFVPKAFTPLSNAGMQPVKILEERRRFLAKEMRSAGVTCDLPSVREAWAQGILSMGDRRVGRALVKIVGSGEAAGSWWRNWGTALSEAGVNAQRTLTPREDAILPWHFVAPGTPKRAQGHHSLKA